MNKDKYEFMETGGIGRREKEESFLKALINTILFVGMIGGFIWVVLKLIEIGAL